MKEATIQHVVPVQHLFVIWMFVRLSHPLLQHNEGLRQMLNWFLAPGRKKFS